MFHEDGASTAKTDTLVSRNASITFGNGSRTSPSKLNPKMESTTWSLCLRAESKSSVNGMSRSLSCLDKRCHELNVSIERLEIGLVVTW